MINRDGRARVLTEEAPPVPEAGPAPKLLSRGRLILMAVAFSVEIAIFFLGLLIPVDHGTQGALLNQTGGEFSAFQNAPPLQVVFLIFSHNAVIAPVDAIPAVGAFVFATSIFSTGVLAQVLVASNGVPGVFGAFLLIFPYSLVELSAYAVALGAGVMLIAAWGKKRLRSEVRVLAEELVVVLALLLLAASMEEATSLSPPLGIALWIPTGVAISLLAVIVRRRIR